MNERYPRRFDFANTPGRATIEVSSLPGGAHIEYTGVAVRDLQQRKAVRPKNMPPSPTASPCVFAGDTLYCSAKSGFIPGPHGGVYGDTTPQQARRPCGIFWIISKKLVDFSQVVATNVYLDNLSDASNCKFMVNISACTFEYHDSWCSANVKLIKVITILTEQVSLMLSADPRSERRCFG
jgi:enamine deaminase RidA (YjgF/YER057c/UK114 family)